MASDPNRVALKQIDRLFQGGILNGLDDGQLLDRFVADHDELAIEALVEWQGPMVLGACRRWLANSNDVDDAFQATFLILVQKARALRDVRRLGPWLHGVAYRVAARARADAVRRRALERAGARTEHDADIPSPERLTLRAEVCGIVDEEVARLPRSLRAGIVLCDLQGYSQHDAAQLLGWSDGALRGRLSRARQKLRDRLERRGIAPAAWPAGGHLLSGLIPPSPPRSLIDATARAVTASALAGRAAPSASTVISASVAALAQGVIRAMTVSTVKMATLATILTATSLLAVGGFVRAGLFRIEADPKPGAPLLAGSEGGGQAAKTVGEPKPELTPGLPIGGFVKDEQGRPIEGAEVTVAISQRQVDVPDADVPVPANLSVYAGFPHIRVNTDAQGRWQCSILPANADETTRIWLFVKHPDYVSDTGGYSRRLSLKTARAMTGALILSTGVNVRGRVRDGKGQPVAGARVVLAYSPSAADALRATTDAAGRFSFTHAINSPLRVRGTVVGTESKQPVRSFTAIPATSFQGDRGINWQRARAVKASEGRYEIAADRPDQPTAVYHVRIEADGYAPMTSRPIKPDEGEITLDFALKKAPQTSGVVRLADGTPAVGADVYVDGLGINTNQNGPPAAPGFLADRHRKTGPDGHYALPPRDEPFGIVVVHDKGFGNLSADELAGSADVTLKPWGRIEGTFRIRGKPGVQQQIDVNVNRSVIAPSYTFQGYRATTDNQGRFVIERVMDGEVSFTWSSGQRPLTGLSSAGPAVNIRAGQSLQVDLGGRGRPLIGRIVVSPAEIPNHVDAVAPVSPGNGRGWIEIRPAEMPLPPDFVTWETAKRLAYKIKWYSTEERKAYLRNRRFHSLRSTAGPWNDSPEAPGQELDRYRPRDN
jgi:RNA polymerase sigma factor (sigma-70 family)